MTEQRPQTPAAVLAGDTYLPQSLGRRHALLGMCFLAMFIAYTDRVNISVASVAMREQLAWSQTTKGMVLSSFFIGYMLFMVTSGWLATRFGGKRVLAISVAWWSTFTLLTPWAASLSIATLVAARIALGIGEAAVMPATYELFRRWVPESERSRAVTRFLSGIPVGQIVGFTVAGWLTGRFGWPASFYLFGLIGFVWTAFWLAGVTNDPADDRQITAEELRLLPRRSVSKQPSSGPALRALLTKSPVWAIFIAHFCNNWGLYLLIAWLPSYFRDAMGLGFANAGIYAAAPWVAAFVAGNVVAAVADKAIARGAGLGLVRKLIVAVGLLGFAASLLLVRDAHTSTTALLLVCAATGALGICWSGFAPNMLDIAPRHCAVLIGVSNTLATIPGVAGVAITGWLLDRTGSYSATFTLTAAVAVLGAVVYLIFGSAKPMDE
jgi:MFS transporter, ACS family, solute carrier family 17 (sodium-dependent inorganic phosphate cotransporter), other